MRPKETAYGGVLSLAGDHEPAIDSKYAGDCEDDLGGAMAVATPFLASSNSRAALSKRTWPSCTAVFAINQLTGHGVDSLNGFGFCSPGIGFAGSARQNATR